MGGNHDREKKDRVKHGKNPEHRHGYPWSAQHSEIGRNANAYDSFMEKDPHAKLDEENEESPRKKDRNKHENLSFSSLLTMSQEKRSLL